MVLYVHKGKGNRNKTEKRNWRFVGGNFGSLDPTRRRKKKKVPPRSVAVKEILGPWIPLEGKKKKKVPPKFVAVKEKERKEKYIFFKNKNQKIRINMKP